eukprot:9136360-Lingulodinium_polyedra.AAC.1
MRSSRLSSATAASKSHTHALHANTCSHEVRGRTISVPIGCESNRANGPPRTAATKRSVSGGGI